ncbi:fumarylacetoacetate hydrolase family protein [Amycolatopsis jejuensis]|uniref:fumarylacetoacetate hydrolase family protein n=1 Tax=Amycolatopsis jejuensis TaxID=330084 RepID=UPI000527E4A2|nr:fumarylacetoacetate hydrolase family protein [Amycolatopsis jejuensis]
MTTTPRYRLAAASAGGESLVVLAIGERLVALRDLVDGPVPPLPDVIAGWDVWSPRVAAAAGRAGAAPTVEPDAWLLPVNPDKLVCIGTNYYDHLKEMGTPVGPKLPYAFLKPASTGLVASGTTVQLPARSKMVDWEAELAVVIGRTPAEDDEDILDSVAGYTVLNDLSARDWIKSKPEVGIDWVMQKAYDGFSPVGPFFVPREFVADPQALAIRCWVNGEIKQDSSTAQMIFGVEAILRHLAGIMTLRPGDVIATGTPAGVGFGARPQQFLRHGDTVAVEIEGIGRLETRMSGPLEGVTE